MATPSDSPPFSVAIAGECAILNGQYSNLVSFLGDI